MAGRRASVDVLLRPDSQAFALTDNRYANLSHVEAGEYLVAIHRDDAPDPKYPFATFYCPGVEDERDAEHVPIGASSQAVLSPLRLKRLDVATIDVNVVWPDGTRPK